MFYVDTENENYTITTSYTTEKQARRYGGKAYEADLRLQSEDLYGPYEVEEFSEEGYPVGNIRTIFRSKLDGSKAGKFLLYLRDDKDRWAYSGITFASCSDANQTIKNCLSRTFGDMLIIENADVEAVYYGD